MHWKIGVSGDEMVTAALIDEKGSQLGYARKNMVGGFAAFSGSGSQYLGQASCLGMAMNLVKDAHGITGRVPVLPA